MRKDTSVIPSPRWVGSPPVTAEDVQSPRNRGRDMRQHDLCRFLAEPAPHAREPWRLQFKTYRLACVWESIPRYTRVVAPRVRDSPQSMASRRATRRQVPAIATHAWVTERVRRGPRRRNQAWETWARDGIPREAARNGRQEASR